MTTNETTLRRADDGQRARLSRRDFLGVVLGTVPAAALPGGALARLWPEAELDREVDEPWVLALDGETLWDPAGDGPTRVPSLRAIIADSYPDVLTATGPELDAVLTQYLTGWEHGYEVSDDELPEALEKLRERLDQGLAMESGEFEQWYGQQLNGEAWTTWLKLPEDIQERFDVYLVEGDRPGSDLTYIQYTGTLDDLNRKLAAAGLNIVVIEHEPCYDLLYPGEPGY